MPRSSKSFAHYVETFDRSVKEFCRSEVGQHLINSHKEVLLAMRAAIDCKINHIEEFTETESSREVEVE